MRRSLSGQILFFLLCFLGTGWSGVAYALEEKPIRVGIFDYQAFYGTDEKNRPAGYGYEYLDALARYGDFKYEYVYASWVDCLTMLEKGEIDLLDSVQKTPERERKYLFSDFSTGTSFGEILVRSDNNTLTYNDFGQLNGKRVALLKGNSRNEGFYSYAHKLGFSTVNVFYNTAAEMSDALQKNEVEAIVSSNLRASHNEKPVARFSPTPFYIAVNKNNAKLISRVNSALEQIVTENPGFNARLGDKYYFNSRYRLLLTKEEREFISNSPKITVVYGSSSPPFESCDPEKGAEGVSVDILNMVAQRTGLEFEFVDGLGFSEAIAAVSSQRADMLLTYGSNQARAKDVDLILSDSFLSAPMAIVGKTYNINPTSVFVVPRTSPRVISAVKDYFTDNPVLELDSMEDCYNAIKTGAAAYTFENIYTATEVVESKEYGELVIALVTPLTDNFSFAFNESINPLYIRIINKAIASISKSEKDFTLLNYVTNKINASGQVAIESYQQKIVLVFAIVAILIIVALILIVVWQRKNRKMLWRVAYIDPLTGAANIDRFKLDARELVAAHSDRRYAVIKMDMRDFKLFNGAHGFVAGDNILRKIALTLQEILRPGVETYARIINDEFIILKELDCFEDNCALEAKADVELEKGFLTRLNSVFDRAVAFRFGYYVLQPGETDLTEVIEKATYAHSLARDTVGMDMCVYDNVLRQTAIDEKILESKMEKAMQNENFVLYLQPKYKLQDESIAGAEALARWHDDAGNDVEYPGRFIPLFEKNGFITRLDMYMLDKACKIIASWIENGIEPVPVSVNFSRLHLGNSRFVDELREIVDKYNIPRKYIEVELTESTIFNNEKLLLAILDRLHQAGFTLSMDDFGIGYSSLGLLKNIPVDVIKIDRSFFTLLEDNTRANVVLEHVISMARTLGIHTVAEGVDRQEHIEILRILKCDIVQGYYYSRPMPEEEFEKLLRGRAFFN